MDTKTFNKWTQVYLTWDELDFLVEHLERTLDEPTLSHLYVSLQRQLDRLYGER